MSNVLILGATGSLGKHLTQQAIAADHEVSALVRNPSKLPAEIRDKIVVHQADLATTSASSLATIFANHASAASASSSLAAVRGSRTAIAGPVPEGVTTPALWPSKSAVAPTRTRATVRGTVLAVLSSCLTPGCGAPPTAPYDGALTFTADNDLFTGSDNNYTNGMAIAWATGDVATYDDGSFVREWSRFWDFLPFVGNDGYRTYASWALGQEMHTPDDITDPDPPADDQPYAGVLYLDSVFRSQGERWRHTWNLRLGVVGPASQADDFQTWFHEEMGADTPMGWDTQLPNEPIVNVTYSTACLLAEADLGGGAAYRIVPVGDVSVGNYFTGAALGMYGEIGWNLVDAYSFTGLRGGFSASSTMGVGPVDDWSVSLFTGIGGVGVGHYLPLDGTVFRDSASVDSNPFVGMATLGLSVRHGLFALTVGQTYSTDAFEGQKQNAEFGTVSVSWYF